MSDEYVAESVEQLRALPIGTWVIDADGDPWCLVNTHVMHPQVMWMGRKGKSLVAIDQIALPAHEGEFEGDCEHRWGHNECGHCRRCGQVVAPEDDHESKVWGVIGVRIPTGPRCPRGCGSLTWHGDGWGYRCDACGLFVAIPKQAEPEAKPVPHCGKDVAGTVPAWAGEDQIDPCSCVRPSKHDGQCACAHQAPEDAVPEPDDAGREEADRA